MCEYIEQTRNVDTQGFSVLIPLFMYGLLRLGTVECLTDFIALQP